MPYWSFYLEGGGKFRINESGLPFFCRNSRRV
jgi:hypothetical protein